MAEVTDDMKHCYENLILIDVGANLTNKKYSRDLDTVIQRAQDSGKRREHRNFPYVGGTRCTSTIIRRSRVIHVPNMCSNSIFFRLILAQVFRS